MLPSASLASSTTVSIGTSPRMASRKRSAMAFEPLPRPASYPVLAAISIAGPFAPVVHPRACAPTLPAPRAPAATPLAASRVGSIHSPALRAALMIFSASIFGRRPPSAKLPPHALADWEAVRRAFDGDACSADVPPASGASPVGQCRDAVAAVRHHLPEPGLLRCPCRSGPRPNCRAVLACWLARTSTCRPRASQPSPAHASRGKPAPPVSTVESVRGRTERVARERALDLLPSRRSVRRGTRQRRAGTARCPALRGWRAVPCRARGCRGSWRSRPGP